MPTLLLDKSAFQALGEEDLKLARREFELLATDVLLLEILGDTRYEDARATSFARKLRAADAVVNMPSHEIAASELLGERVPMNRVPLLKGTPVRNAAGELGVVAEASAGDEALYRWSRGEFDETDKKAAEAWVSGTRSFDLGFFERGVRASPVRDHVPASLDDLMDLLDTSLADPTAQADFLDSFLAYLPVPEHVKGKIRARWHTGGLRLERDAPYSRHCLRVLLGLFLGVGSRLVGTRSTNFVDAHYLMYLPFCSAFASGDALHEHLFPHFRREDQTLLAPSELRALLRARRK